MPTQAVLDEPSRAAQPSGPARLAIIIVVAVIALAVIAALIISADRGPTTPPWPATEEQQIAECLTERPGAAQAYGHPVERLSLYKDDGWLRVYVTELYNWIIVCQGGPRALMAAFATTMETGAADKLRFFGGYDSVLKGHLLLGHVPTGGALVEARLADGRTVSGDHDGDIFAVWSPDVSVDGAQVTVFTRDRAVVDMAWTRTKQR